VFNVGIGEIAVIVLVCLIVFGPERLPQMARQVGRFLGQLRLTTQGALDQLKQEADLKDINLPDLRVGSLRSQARDYVRELLDIEGQMAELEREREQIKASLKAEVEPNGSGDLHAGENGSSPGHGSTEHGSTEHGSMEHGSAGQGASAGKGAPVDPEAT
jgi:sec-independent protein translocase protein TatB